MVGKGRVKVVVEGDKDMGKTQIVVESIWGREKENVRVEKRKERR